MIVPEDLNNDLPWGYWLRLENPPSRADVFVENDGTEWPSLREAFWSGRLGMPAVDAYRRDGLLELMLAVLVRKCRGISGGGESVYDIHDGDHMRSWFFNSWLQAAGLLGATAASSSAIRVTAEGRSAMLMLGATRPQPVRAIPPSSISVRTLTMLGMGAASNEDRAREVEAASADWPATFVRRTVGRRFVIVLVKRDVEAPVPVARTVWTQAFRTEGDRDAFYDWLCRRVDRWQVWAKLAWSESGAELKSHLLSVAVLSRRDGEVDATIAPPKRRDPRP